jgi:hypothetical protein
MSEIREGRRWGGEGQEVLPQVGCGNKKGEKIFPLSQAGGVRLGLEPSQCSATTIRRGDAHVHRSVFALSSVVLAMG